VPLVELDPVIPLRVGNEGYSEKEQRERDAAASHDELS
jgi:hypothetical protein